MSSLITKIRSEIGHTKFIHPAARIIIENENGQYLFIRRKDNGNLGIPAGALEESETIEDCIKREVLEETGLIIHNINLIGVSSNPTKETVRYPNGDVIQYFTIEFYCNQWIGEISTNDTQEIAEVMFLDKGYIEELPENEKSTFESLIYFREKREPLIK